MLIAHLAPGYLVAATLEPAPAWNTTQRRLVWLTALGSTVFPDVDVIYNVIFRGFVNHSILWTHSLFLYTGIGLLWWGLRRVNKWSYPRVLLSLMAIGGLSHLALDMIAHNTPLLYPFSMRMVGIAPSRVVEGGLRAYLTDPVFLLEPLLLLVALVYGQRTEFRWNNS